MSVNSELDGSGIRSGGTDSPFIVLGLGNPGPKYVETRHNFGFFVLDGLSQRFRSQAGMRLLKERRKDGLARWEHWSDEHHVEMILLWPLTYMNLSGRALEFLQSTSAMTELRAERILVLVDDMSLPLGQLRLRGKGSSGGHNGLKSIEASLGHQGYPRLRLGIGAPPPSEEVVEYVLDSFRSEEWDTVRAVVKFAATCVADWPNVSFERQMGRVNGWRVETTTEDQAESPD